MAKIRLILLLSQVLSLTINGGNSYENSKEEEENALSGVLDGVMGAMMQGGYGGAGGEAGILSVLSSSLFGNLLGDQNNQVDSSLVETMVSMFTQSMAQTKREEADFNLKNSGIPIPTDLKNLLEKFTKSGGSLFHLVMNELSLMIGAETSKRASEDTFAVGTSRLIKDLFLYWNRFMNSKLGKSLWDKSELKNAFKAFEGPGGKIDFCVMFKKLEHYPLRRHWVKAAAIYVTNRLVYIANPVVYETYQPIFVIAEYLINACLGAYGVPRNAHFFLTKPEESIANLANHFLKETWNVDVDASDYVNRPVQYFKKLMKLAKTTSQTLAYRHDDYDALAHKITITLNLEVIEPVLRIYRAYMHLADAPDCWEYCTCTIYKLHAQDTAGLPGSRAGIAMFTGQVASALLTLVDGQSLLHIYSALQNVNYEICEPPYPGECLEMFHEYEVFDPEVASEVNHTEL